MTNLVRFRPMAGTASGRRVGWVKHVTGVDPKGTNGYAFAGDFLANGREVELPVGAVLLYVEPRGSVKKSWQSAEVFKLGPSADLKTITPGPIHWRDDFLQVRDSVTVALELSPTVSDTDNLASVSDAALLTGAEKRGLI